MKKENTLKLKELSVIEFGEVVDTIVNSHFIDGKYTPYYYGIGFVNAVLLYMVDGVEFDKDDMIYSLYKEDEDLHKIVEQARNSSVMDEINSYVYQVVEFEKQKMIRQNDKLDKIVEAAGIIIDSLENFAHLNINALSDDDVDLAKTIMAKLANSDVTFDRDTITNIIKDASELKLDESSKEIIDAKNAEIIELKEKLDKK